MGMSKFLKKNWILLTLIVAVILAILLIAGTRKPGLRYKLSQEEVLQVLSDTGNSVDPHILAGSMLKRGSAPVLIDVRNSDEFSKGHIGDAVNIPVPDLFGEKAVDLFRELDKSGQMAILYGEDQLQAFGPWLLLKQAGYRNIKVLEGGYSYYKLMPMNDSIREASSFRLVPEKLLLDTAEFRAKQEPAVISASKEENKPAKQIKPVKKQASSGGGC